MANAEHLRTIMKPFTLKSLAAASVAVAAAVLVAGPLDPPSGPVSGSYKTLGEVEPRIAINEVNTPGDDDSLYKITQPGSYYLTGNVTGVAGKHGIEVEASNVTIDLGRFTLVGHADSLRGVVLSESAHGCTIQHGTIDGWAAGVAASTATRGTTVHHIVVMNCDGSGFFLGSSSSANSCKALNNGGFGISIYSYGVLRDCQAENSGTDGIYVGNGSVLEACTTAFNAGNGMYVSAGSVVESCSSFDNTLSGFTGEANTAVVACNAQNNGVYGIRIASGVVRDCAVQSNESKGVYATGSALIESCRVEENLGDGIQVSSDSTVRNNQVALSGFAIGNGAGIHVTGSDNRIEGNNCTKGDRGIEVDAAGNHIVGNSCSGNAVNWDVVGGNACVVYLAVVSPAINGDSGGNSPAAKDPHANFTY